MPDLKFLRLLFLLHHVYLLLKHADLALVVFRGRLSTLDLAPMPLLVRLIGLYLPLEQGVVVFHLVEGLDAQLEVPRLTQL